jgi:thiamine transport system permease protein
LTLRLKGFLLWAAPLTFVAVLFYWPLLRVLHLGFGEHLVGTNPAEISIWPVLWFTIWQAVVSTALALILGLPGAYVLYRKTFRGAALIRSLITVPFMLPSLVVAIAITELGALIGGLDPVVAIILANVFANYAVVVRTVGSQWQTLDRQTDEEAEVAGAGRFSSTFRVALPQLRSSIRSSSAIVLLYCASSYGIVLSLGGGKVNTLETAISISVLQRLDLQHGSALALLQIAFCLAAFTASRWGGTNPLSFEPNLSKATKLDKRDFPAIAFVLITSAVLVFLPLLLVLAKSFISSSGEFTLSNFLLLDSRGSRDLLNITFLEAGFNSIRNVVIATVISVLVGALVSYLLAEHSRRHSRTNKKTDLLGIVLDAYFLLPIGVSAVVIGLGYLITLTGGFAWLRSSWILVPLVQAMLAIPMVVRVLYPALLAIDHSAREQAMTDGARMRHVFFYIDLALVKPVLKTAIAFSALVSLGEFGAASLLAYGDQSTVPMLMYQLIARPGNQNYGMALAVATILTVLTTIIVLLVSREPSSRMKPVKN